MDMKSFLEGLKKASRGVISGNVIEFIILKNSITDFRVFENGFSAGKWAYDGEKITYDGTEVGEEEFIEWVLRFKEKFVGFSPEELRRMTAMGFRYVGVYDDGDGIYSNGKCEVTENMVKYGWDVLRKVVSMLGDMGCRIIYNSVVVRKEFGDGVIELWGYIHGGYSKVMITKVMVGVEKDLAEAKTVYVSLEDIVDHLEAADSVEDFFLLFMVF